MTVKGSFDLAVRMSSLTLVFLSIGEKKGSYQGWKSKGELRNCGIDRIPFFTGSNHVYS